LTHEIMLPARVMYGLGAFAEIGRQAKVFGRKALIVSDPVMEKIGHVDNCVRHLEEADVDYAIYCGVHTEPTDRHVEEAVRICRDASCDVIIAVGGGSCIDAAKATAVMMTNDGYIGDYAGGRKTFERRPLPLIAVPTTAGTGSEVTKVTVIINTRNDVKMMISQPDLLPQAAIIDATLSMSCPPSVIAASGIDALCHAMEAYLSRRAQPVTDGWALQAVDLIFRHLPSLYSKQGKAEDFEKVALGAMLAGAAFSNASVTLVHGMSRPIGALFHVPHGISNAMLLPAVLEFTFESAIERMAEIGRIMIPESAASSREAQAAAMLGAVRKLCRSLNVPNLRDYGIEREAFLAAVPKMAADAMASGSPSNNLRTVTTEEIEDLYRLCFDYSFGSNEQEVGSS
jgi:alcohol dehydrogenase class IV